MLDHASSMPETLAPPLHDRIARRVRELRAARGLSLEAMAARCDVSRSMLSLIERGESSPTAVVLEKIATGLRVPLASLFEAPPVDDAPIARRDEQPLWRDPQSGYVRRSVSPGGSTSPIHIVEVSFPPGARVAYETGAREPRIHQQVWVLAGAIVVTMGDRRHRLRRGDCLAMQLDRPISFHNETRRGARYAVVLVSDAARGV
jgi:transcriptional regulator with XRE-family HTH domain